MRHTKKNKKTSFWQSLIDALGSVYFAVFLIAALAAILISSTFLESKYGTPFAQKFFYQADWFDIILSLIWINMFLAVVKRFPLKKYHTGFVVTHIGILLLLIGALLSRMIGMNGQMVLREGQKLDYVTLETYQLAAHTSNGKAAAFSLKPKINGTFSRDLGNGFKLTVDRIIESAKISSEVEDDQNSSSNAAIHFFLRSERAGFENSFWLVEHGEDPGPTMDLGMANFELKRGTASYHKSSAAADIAGPMIKITMGELSQTQTVEVTPAIGKEIPLGDGKFKMIDLIYYPDARVGDGNKLVNVSDVPNNPAVEFDIANSKGIIRHFTKFALFPDFESMHGKKEDEGLNIEAELLAGSETKTPEMHGAASLTFYAPINPADPWTYESHTRHGDGAHGVIEQGKNYPAGWMDFSISIDKLLRRAVITQKVEPLPFGAKGEFVVQTSLSKNGKDLGTQWLAEGGTAFFDSPDGPVLVALGRKSEKVPFMLGLKDFRKVDYPGTAQPSSFESDVKLEDADAGITIDKTIKMNKPLDYKGYRIFQSSYAQDEEGETSIFTVAKNPGIIFIYSGAVIMFAGVIMLFYLKPFSSFHERK